MNMMLAQQTLKTTPRKWTQQEDDILRAVVERFGARNWKEIAKHVPDRSHVQCLQRWNKVLRPGLKKGTWQQEEDERLTAEVNIFLQAGGEVNWSVIARCIEGRTAKQCRERWRCNLDPNINKAEWTTEEDMMIVNLQRELGNRWALLAKSLPGRTENAIKTRFRSLQRSNKRKWTSQEDALLMQMICSGSSFEDVAKTISRRTLNSVRVRYKQLCDSTQTMQPTPQHQMLSPPRAPMFSMPPPSQPLPHHHHHQQHLPHHMSHPGHHSSSHPPLLPSGYPSLMFPTHPLEQPDFSSPSSLLLDSGSKRLSEFDDDHNPSKIAKLEVY